MSAKRIVFVMVTAVVLSLGIGQMALANYYAGNSRSVGYGVKADIGTPSYAPNVDDWIASFVSTGSSLAFVQTGWCIEDDYNPARSYVETYVAQSYDLDWYSAQAYDFARTYEVVHTGSGSTWRALIQGTPRGTWGPLSYPQTVVAQSEVYNSPGSQLKGTFNNVQYKGQYQYFLFNENNFYSNSPYWVEVFYNYKYNTHGNGM